jgi:hypothetical protein
MKSITRFTSALIVFAIITIPASASAAGAIWGNGWGVEWGGGAGGGGGLGCALGTLCGIGLTILNIINGILVPVLFALAFIVFLYGVATKYIFSHGDADKVSEGHKLILWGLIAFAVMVSLWGLVNVVANTFGLTGWAPPDLPTSY